MTLVIDDLQLLDYDLFGKCSDLINFIENRKSNQITQPQIKAAAKLTNLLIQFLKQQEAWKYLNESENEEIIFILKNNFKKIQRDNFGLEAKNYELENQIKEQLKKIQQLTLERNTENKNNQTLSDTNQAQKDFISQLQENQDQFKVQLLSENKELSEQNDQLQNEVNRLTNILKFREQKIQKQEGEITNLQQNLNKFQNDQNQDQNNQLFNRYEGIFNENQSLKDKIKQLFLNKQSYFQRLHIVDEEQQPENEEIQNQELIKQLQESQKNILKYFNEFSTYGVLLSICIGTYVILKLNE